MNDEPNKFQFLDPPPESTDRSTARVRLIPVPYDKTSTYRKGADRGPNALLEASTQVEWFDIETRTEPYKVGLHTESPILHHGSPEDLAPLVRDRVARTLADGALPVVIGGEHSVTIGAVEAVADQAAPFSVLQIDAHGDTRDTYQGSTHNHACVMARAMEHATVVQVGIRAIDRPELERMDEDRVFWGHEIANATDDGWMDDAISKLENRVYLTIDLDAFDPSILPATGTPEPGGMDWRTVNELIRRVARARTIVGFDVVELCPHEAHHGSDFVAAKLVHRVIAEIFAADQVHG